MKFLCLICAETEMEQMSAGRVEVRPIAEDSQTLQALGMVAHGTAG